MGRVTVVVGGQYGSEGKGNLVACQFAQHDVHVRVGAPNAGHTIIDPISGEKFKMQCIPCGWINRYATLIIGAGAIINKEVLQREVAQIAFYDPSIRDRLIIDNRAWLIENDDVQYEKSDGLRERIGSTTEGVGVARERRMARKGPRSNRWHDDIDVSFGDTVAILHDMRFNSSRTILVEGTQGSALSLYHGSYPYVTSCDSNACGILSECGLAPGDDIDVVLVFRTFPIRVAGNSGPLRNETSWEELSVEIGRAVQERTTVTKKIRRVGYWDYDMYIRAIKLNNPRSIAIMFADYIDPDMANKKETRDITPKFANWVINNCHPTLYAQKIAYIGTGEASVIAINSKND